MVAVASSTVAVLLGVTLAVGIALGFFLGQRSERRAWRDVAPRLEQAQADRARERREVALALGMETYEHENVLARVQSLREQELGIPEVL